MGKVRYLGLSIPALMMFVLLSSWSLVESSLSTDTAHDDVHSQVAVDSSENSVLIGDGENNEICGVKADISCLGRDTSESTNDASGLIR